MIDLIKGNAEDTYTIKQIGGELKNRNMALRVHGVPKFHVGKNYVVFLPAKSKLGFSSPLGLHQGSFSVLNINGEQVVSNGRSQANQPQQVQQADRDKPVEPYRYRWRSVSTSLLSPASMISLILYAPIIHNKYPVIIYE